MYQSLPESGRGVFSYGTLHLDHKQTLNKLKFTPRSGIAGEPNTGVRRPIKLTVDLRILVRLHYDR